MTTRRPTPRVAAGSRPTSRWVPSAVAALASQTAAPQVSFLGKLKPSPSVFTQPRIPTTSPLCSCCSCCQHHRLLLLPSAAQRSLLTSDYTCNAAGNGPLRTTKVYAGGICCPMEVPLIESLLSPLPGVFQVRIGRARMQRDLQSSDWTLLLPHVVPLVKSLLSSLPGVMQVRIA